MTKHIKLIALILLGLLLCSCTGVLNSEMSYCEQYAEISRLNEKIKELEANGTEIVEVYFPYEVEKPEVVEVLIPVEITVPEREWICPRCGYAMEGEGTDG